MSNNRAKIEITYVGTGLPDIKFFGDINPNDVRFAKLAIQRSYSLYIIECNNKAKHKRMAAEEAVKQKELEAKTIAKEANKENKDESGITKPVEERPGNVTSGSIGSGNVSGSRNTGTIRANRS